MEDITDSGVSRDELHLAPRVRNGLPIRSTSSLAQRAAAFWHSVAQGRYPDRMSGRVLSLLGALALASPASASAGEKTARADPDAAAKPGADAAAAVAAARTDLDTLLSALLAENREDPAESTSELQIEVPPELLTSDAPNAIVGRHANPDLSWLQGLELPDLPVRWHDELLELLDYYRHDARGRAHMRAWLQRSGRYEAMIRATLKQHHLPQDLLYVAMVESGFDPLTESNAGALGMWQFVQSTASTYGLEKNRWQDERRSPERATQAAAAYLGDLYAKLGSWPLSVAAFNMGYGALLRSIRKYNTNDFWLLSRLEAGLPYETVIYVAKVMACAIVARNPERFGLGEVALDKPLELTTVVVPGATSLGRIATVAGVSQAELQAWNPALLLARVPGDVKQWSLRIPSGPGARLGRRYADLQSRQPEQPPHLLRFGERLKDVAEMYGTTERRLRALNDLGEDEPVRPGLRLKVPDAPVQTPDDAEPTVVAVPRLSFSYPNRSRVFYRVRDDDRAEEIAKFFKVELRELRLWNAIAPDARLHQGMVLQLFVPRDVDLKQAVYLPAGRVQTLAVGSNEFLDYHEGLRERVRIRYRVQAGDTLASLAERFELSVGSICRINGFSRDRVLAAGSEIVLYTKGKDPVPKPDSRQASRR
jgi:membrane-bound lytic murein transglycosylase D